MWHNHLKSIIESRGFKKINDDQCLFISYKVIYVAYVNYCIFFNIYQNYIDVVLEYFDNYSDQYNWNMRK